MNALTVINICLCSVFVLCYAYQFVYVVISYLIRPKAPETEQHNNFAVLICARNEEGVIARLISSLNEQNYPKDKYTVFLVADNCTDNTFEVAKASGATVYERFNTEKVGKGYALDFLITSIKKDYGKDAFDAFAIFDADNVVDPDFLKEINKTMALGYHCVTSYRASSNYGDNWISAGQGMCFLRDMVMLNRARMAIGAPTFVSGTGYCFSNTLIEEIGGGWPFTTLTEDCEFTIHNAVKNTKMGYCDTARFYDEQPTTFSESWKQRLRWCRGGIQVFAKYVFKLLGQIFRGRILSCLDMIMCMAPAYLISVGLTVINTVGTVIALLLGADPVEIAITMGLTVAGVYAAFLAFSIPLTISEWKWLGNRTFKKILYMFTFPFFMLTFLPITCVALVKRKVVWHQTARKKQ